MHYVYLLESEKFDEIYVGSTNDLKRRLEEHNLGKEISTKRYRPWHLVSYEAYQSEEDARHRENMLKQHGSAMRQFKIKSKNSFINKRDLPSTIFSGKNSAGFTFIETLIYIAIIGVVVTGFITFSISVSNSRNKTYVVQEVQANSRTALDLIGQRIRASTGVNTGTSTFGSDPGVLSLSMSDSAKNPTIIDLSADNGVIQITEGVSLAVPITSDEVRVTNLVFMNLTPSGERENIRIQLTVEYNNTSGDVEFGYSQNTTTSVSVRQ